MRCKQCNAEFEANRSYCPQCGASITRNSAVEQERRQRNAILAERAVESAFPFPALENELVLLYYWQGKRLRWIEWVLYLIFLLIPLFYRIPFTESLTENFRYTLFVCLGGWMMLVATLRWMLRFRAKACEGRPIPVLGIGLAKRMKVMGAEILRRAAMQRRSMPTPDLDTLRIETLSPRFRRDWIIRYGVGAVLMAVYYMIVIHLIGIPL